MVFVVAVVSVTGFLTLLLLFVELLLSIGPVFEADAERLRRSAPCELDESESELDEFESVSLELPLDDDEPDVLPELESLELTDCKRTYTQTDESQKERERERKREENTKK